MNSFFFGNYFGNNVEGDIFATKIRQKVQNTLLYSQSTPLNAY